MLDGLSVVRVRSEGVECEARGLRIEGIEVVVLRGGMMIRFCRMRFDMDLWPAMLLSGYVISMCEIAGSWGGRERGRWRAPQVTHHRTSLDVNLLHIGEILAYH